MSITRGLLFVLLLLRFSFICFVHWFSLQGNLWSQKCWSNYYFVDGNAFGSWEVLFLCSLNHDMLDIFACMKICTCWCPYNDGLCLVRNQMIFFGWTFTSSYMTSVSHPLATFICAHMFGLVTDVFRLIPLD